MKPKGAFFELGDVSWFLRGSLVTDCDFGPDGALWFSDWVYGWEQTGKGRVYRAFEPETTRSALVAETRTLLAAGMDGRGPGSRTEDELFELLGHPDQRVRQEAHFALAERGDPGRLATLALSGGPHLFARLHAVWALGIALRRWANAGGALLAACEASDQNVKNSLPPSSEAAEVRAQAIRVLGDACWADAAPMVVRRLSDPSPRVRFFAALASGRLAAPKAIDPLRKILVDAGTQDPNLRHAAVMGLVGCASAAELDRLSADPDRDVRLGALLAMRHHCAWRGFEPMHTSGRQPELIEAQKHAALSLPRFLLDEDPQLVLEAARAIHDLPIEPALESLAKARVGKEQFVVGERALVRRVLNANYRLGRADTLASYAERADLSLESRLEALDMLAHFEKP